MPPFRNNAVHGLAAETNAEASNPTQSNRTSNTGGSDLSQVDDIIACLEGAITMFKNATPGLKQSFLILVI